MTSTVRLDHNEWTGATYGGSRMLRALKNALKICPVRLLYLFAYLFIVPGAIAFKGKYRGALWRFYRNDFRFGRFRSCRILWRNHCAFARVVIDRFAAFAGKKFELQVDGYEHYARLVAMPGSFMQLSCHIGHYEMAGYTLDAKQKPINAVLFAGEKEEVMRNRLKLFSGNSIRMIAMKPDMSHLFEINNAISREEIISMDADRIFGSQKYYTVPFLNSTAKIPQGAFKLAALHNLPVLFIAVVSPKPRHYLTTVTPLTADGNLPTGAKAEAIARDYARNLELTAKRYPEQWFNFFDFTGND